MLVLYPNSYAEEGIKDPDWQTVEHAMLQLDGSRSTFVSLGQEDPELDQVLVGGGDKAFIVDARVDGNYYSLLNPAEVPGYVRLVAAGEESEFEAKYVVPYELALKAVRWFFEHHTLDPSLRWE